MRAARFSRFGGPEVLEIVDLPDPHPGPGQVRITVHAAGINATEWKLRRGLLDFGEELPRPPVATWPAWSTRSARG